MSAMYDYEESSENYYELLQVHPAAPLELITGAYWWLINREQQAKNAGYDTEMALHHLTKAYQTLADPILRRSHDVSLGLPPPAPFPALPPRLREPHRRRRSLMARRAAKPEPEDVSVDYYELLRVHPQAEPPILALARAVVRNHYLRHVRFGEASAELLELLEEAYAVLSDPDARPKVGAAKEEEGDLPGRVVPRNGEQAPPDGGSITPPWRRGREALARFGEAARGVVDAFTARKSARPTASNGSEEEAALVERLKAWGTAPVQPPAPAAPETAPALTVPEAAAPHTAPALTAPQTVAPDPALPLAAAEVVAARTAPALAAPEAAASGAAPTLAAPATAAPGVAPMLARLVVTGGPQTGSEFALNGLPITVGAAKRCDVVLAGTADRQAWIWASRGDFVILNLTQEPAMMVAGRRVVQATLQDGDLLTIAHHRIRFDLIS